MSNTGDVESTEFGLAMAGAAVAVTAWGSVSVLVVHIDMGGLAVGVYRFWIYAIALLLWMTFRGNPLTWRTMRYSAAGGIALAADVALFFTAIKETTIINATLIGALQPIVVGVVAWRFFGERIRAREMALGLVAILATAVVVVASTGSAEWNVWGDILALGALFAWSGYFIASKASRTHMTSGDFTLGTALWVSILTTPVALLVGQDLSWPSPENLALLTGLAFGAGIVGHVLMNWSLVRIPLWLGSTFTLLVPVVAAFLAWAFLDQELNAVQIGAMAVVLAALALLVAGQTSGPPTMPKSESTASAPSSTAPSPASDE